MDDSERQQESEWIKQCQDGDKEAFGLLVRKYMKRAYYVALGIVGAHDEALDLSQEAFVRAFRSIHTFDLNRKFFTWYYQILRNLCLNYLRDSKKEFPALSILIEEDIRSANVTEDADQVTKVEQSELKELIWNALWKLKWEERQLIVARDLLDTPYKTLAEILDCPIGTVMSRLYYARKALRKKIEELSS